MSERPTSSQFLARLALSQSLNDYGKLFVRLLPVAALLGAGILLSGIGPMAALAPLTFLLGTGAGTVLGMAASYCYRLRLDPRLPPEAKPYRSRRLRREMAVLTLPGDRPAPKVYLLRGFYNAGMACDGESMLVGSDFNQMSRRHLVAALAHELGHHNHPQGARELLKEMREISDARIIRAVTLGGCIGLLPVAPVGPLLVVAGVVALNPYVQNVLFHARRRREEFAADQDAVRRLGTPVPLLQLLRKLERSEKAMSYNNSQPVSSWLPMQLALETMTGALKRPAEVFFQIATANGPFTDSHPSLRRRRKALHNLPRCPARMAQLKIVVPAQQHSRLRLF
jgi:Zn-dependent protease with chaperone function